MTTTSWRESHVEVTMTTMETTAMASPRRYYKESMTTVWRRWRGNRTRTLGWRRVHGDIGIVLTISWNLYHDVGAAVIKWPEWNHEAGVTTLARPRQCGDAGLAMDARQRPSDDCCTRAASRRLNGESMIMIDWRRKVFTSMQERRQYDDNGMTLLQRW